MGNGADKILSICEQRGIEISDFFASDGFVRGHEFHGKRVLSYSEAKEKYGAENMIVLLSFASSLPDVLANIYRIADECELYAPDVPVCGTNLFDGVFYERNEERIEAVESLLADEKSKEVYRSVICPSDVGIVILYGCGKIARKHLGGLMIERHGSNAVSIKLSAEHLVLNERQSVGYLSHLRTVLGDVLLTHRLHEAPTLDELHSCHVGKKVIHQLLLIPQQ